MSTTNEQSPASSLNPSILHIIWNDYTAFLATAAPIIMWVLWFALPLFDRKPAKPSDFWMYIAVVTVVGFGVLVWRIRMIFSAFEDGSESTATISNISFFRDRGRVDYIFTFQGQKYMSGNAVMKTKRTRALNIGDQVTVVLDRSQPKKAFIRQLYS